jgi:hypothetical protein
MSDDKPDKPDPIKPDPIEDVRKGLGLLFRAAKGAYEQLPTRKVEDAVLTGAREVGRAIENVTEVIDKQLFKRESSGPPHASGTGQPAEAPPGEAKGGDPPAPDEEPKGPRVA